jgi:hypothetical protein
LIPFTVWQLCWQVLAVNLHDQCTDAGDDEWAAGTGKPGGLKTTKTHVLNQFCILNLLEFGLWDSK